MHDNDPGHEVAGLSSRRVLLITIDGVRWDKLQEARTPNIDQLASKGRLQATWTHDPEQLGVPTVSGPGHSTILTGVWPDKHGVASNQIDAGAFRKHPDLFRRLSSTHPELATFAIGDWPPLIESIVGSPHQKKLISQPDPADDGESAVTEITAWAKSALSGEDPSLGFVYFIHADLVGHRSGGASSPYIEAIERIDNAIGSLTAAIKSRGTFTSEDWLILATTDHGHLDHGGHGGPEAEVRQI